MGKQKLLDMKTIQSYDDLPVNNKGFGDGFYPKHKVEVIEELDGKTTDSLYSKLTFMHYLVCGLSVLGMLAFIGLTVGAWTNVIRPDDEAVSPLSANIFATVMSVLVVICLSFPIVFAVRTLAVNKILMPAVQANAAEFAEWFETTQGRKITVNPAALYYGLLKGSENVLQDNEENKFVLIKTSSNGEPEHYRLDYIIYSSKSPEQAVVVLHGESATKYEEVMGTVNTLSKIELSQWETLTLDSLKKDVQNVFDTAVKLEALGSVDNVEVMSSFEDISVTLEALVENKKTSLEASLASSRNLVTAE